MTSPPPTPGDDQALARNRFAILSAVRAGGVAIMLIGLVLWHGPVIAEGGAPLIGAPIFFLGLAESLLLPKWLARKWRSPRG